MNESTLTGESVPLMKEAITMPEVDRPLEIKGQDKVSGDTSNHMLSCFDVYDLGVPKKTDVRYTRSN